MAEDSRGNSAVCLYIMLMEVDAIFKIDSF